MQTLVLQVFRWAADHSTQILEVPRVGFLRAPRIQHQAVGDLHRHQGEAHRHAMIAVRLDFAPSKLSRIDRQAVVVFLSLCP